MKHNPRLNEKVARMKGFADVHPLQPQETVQGALQVINEMARRQSSADSAENEWTGSLSQPWSVDAVYDGLEEGDEDWFDWMAGLPTKGSK